MWTWSPGLFILLQFDLGIFLFANFHSLSPPAPPSLLAANELVPGDVFWPVTVCLRCYSRMWRIHKWKLEAQAFSQKYSYFGGEDRLAQGGLQCSVIWWDSVGSQSSRSWKKVVKVHSGMLFSPKKEWNNTICCNMDGPRDYHTKWSKPDTD